MRLDHFEPLVHHGRRIDRDLRAHAPVGMGDGLLRRGPAHLLDAAFAKRAAARGQDDPARSPRPGRNRSTARSHCARCRPAARWRPQRATSCMNERAGADQHLLVGERDDDAAPDRRQGRRQPGRADDPGHHPVGRPQRRLDQRGRPAARSRCRCRRAPPSARRNGRVRRSRRSARPGARLLGQERAGLRLAVSASTAKASGLRSSRSTVLCPTEPVEPRIVTRRMPSLPFVSPVGCAAGGRRSQRREPGDEVHCHVRTLWPPIRVKQRHCRDRRQQPVEAIEQSAMPGDQAARVLHAEPAFGQRTRQDRRTARQSQARR